MTHTALRKLSLFGLSLSISALLFFIPRMVIHASSQNIPSIAITPQSLQADVITATFSQPIPSGNIIDLELYNNANQKIWQEFTASGGTQFRATTSSLPNGIYILRGGLFTQNWQSNTSWYSDLAELIVPTDEQVTPTPSPTPQQPIATTQTLTLRAAQMAYTNWKNLYVVSLPNTMYRVRRPENNNDTVSEGIGYGMLLAVYANDRPVFNGLWAYAKQYMDQHGLMNWDINAEGNVIGTGSATDADEDMAYALILARQKWQDPIYTTAANQLISAIEQTEITSANLLTPGDNWGNTSVVNPSYLAPSYYKAFAISSGHTQWNTISQSTSSWIAQLAQYSPYGLVPDWINADYSQASIGFDPHQHDFWYDAIRTPIRLLMDYTATKDGNAQMILQKQASFYTAIGTDKLLSGYSITGVPLSNYIDTTFLTGYTAAGQVQPNSTYAQTMLHKLIADTPSGYFGTSLRALTLFVIANQ